MHCHPVLLAASVLRLNTACAWFRGQEVQALLPAAPGQPGQLARETRDLDVLLTAETHNFPCAVAPYPGALPCCPWVRGAFGVWA